MSSDKIIQCKNLRKRFNDLIALDDITFEIYKGELFGLVGPDGAGKTTLMKILCGLEKKDEGEILIFGLNSDANRAEINKRIGYLSQKFSLYGDLTIDENIEFFARIHGVKNFQKRRDELLEFTRLTKFRNRLVDHLSGGMKQKTALASALIHQPEILILDEPTNGVDPVSRRDFWTILSELLKQGITILISTPYLDETERCNRIAMLNKGKILALENPAELKKTITKKVYEIICSPVRTAYQLIQKEFKDTEVQMFGDNINLILEESPERYINFLKMNNVDVLHIKEKIPTIENVFIHLLREKELI
ncbi:MAG: ABC transporter ATP-binding protein [Ignavibacteria bacterium]|jgi:ABC-2 type transport system ATP-binding protein|nr:ABC transporter ATP-binding protein [Ignavibacteria bacterium]MDH7528886.1 ABC transporter ATP-binding protein [Ignavibacteria bacterium]NPV11354.1 ABC transporter ATP-binding protein [Ignavibacteria bacterium]